MKLLRTLAMAAAFAGAAAEDSASPPPPSATTATPSPATSTASPAPTNTTSTPTGSIPSAPVATSFVAADGFTQIKLSSGVTSAKFAIENNVTSVSNVDTIPLTTETKPLMRVELVEPNSSFQLQGLANDELAKLEINGVTSSAEPAKVELATFTKLSKLTSLSFSNIKFVPSAVTIAAPNTLSYLKIATSNAEDVELTTLSGESDLNKVEFSNNTFAQLPLLFYQRTYFSLDITGNITFSSNLTDLSELEYTNAKNNFGDSDMISFQGNCSNVTTISRVRHSVCQTANRTGVRTLTTDNFVTSTPSSASTAAPSPSETKKRDSANTTLTVIVVVISVIAVVLAFLVARRYFWSSSRSSRSPRLNERTVGLISKDESHAAQGKLSFISGDDTLRPMRLEPQEVTITKSVGAAKLWIGDYQGRKVIIKRVEAESNDSYATKALITQAKGLATLKHPSVVGMVGVAWVQGTDFGVVAEFMEKGTLKSILMDLDSDLDLQNKLHMCLDIAQAMLYLHSNERNMYIKQLSSRKVLVNNAIECKVNLFECHSCSAKVELPEVFGAGMLAWEAPEVVTRSGVLNPRKMNIFSLGVLICEIITRVSPYQSEIDEIGHTRADLELLKRIRRQEKLLPHENRREFTELPVAVRDLVERCLSYQPLLRPTAEEVVQILESAKGYSERFGSTTSL